MNAVYLALMKNCHFAVTFFVAKRVAKCDNKVNTSFLVTFLLLIEEKNVTRKHSTGMRTIRCSGHLGGGGVYLGGVSA